MGVLSREQWFRLPLTFRQRWWRETDFDRRPASVELISEAHALLDKETTAAK